MTDIDRIIDFEHRFAKAQASEIVELPFGYAVLQDDFPLSHDHNRIIATSAASADEIMQAAERVLGGAGRTHRMLSLFVDPGRGSFQHVEAELAAEFKQAGYEHEVVSTMIYAGPEATWGSASVRVASLDEVGPAIARDWRVDEPDIAQEEVRQLVERTGLYERGAELVRLVVWDGNEIAARGNLYLDHQDNIAQFESLMTHVDHRGRGHGGALLNDALWRGRQAGCELFFLTAALDDWPRGWYGRLGFADAALVHYFSRTS